MREPYFKLLVGRQAVTESVSTTLSDKFGRISLYVTDGDDAKLL